MGFQRLKSDASFYVFNRGEVRKKLPVYVDDITISAPTDAEADRIVAEVAEHFELRDLGHSHFLLGIEITRDRSKRSLSLSQRQYIIDMLANYGFSGCTPVQTPMEPGLHLTQDMRPNTDAERAEMSEVPYINAVGALIYLSTCIRPDIAYTVSQLGRFSSNPGKQHWAAVKHFFRYLKGTSNVKLTYAPDPSSKELAVYSLLGRRLWR